MAHMFGLLRAVLLLGLILLARTSVREIQYAAGSTAGYRGWVKPPFVGVLAFRHSDGALQFVW